MTVVCEVDWCPAPAVVFVAGLVENLGLDPVDELHAADPPLEVPLCRAHWVDAGRWSEGRIRAIRLAPRRYVSAGVRDAG